jgi:hypothetical protein
VLGGDTDGTNAFDASLEWDSFAQDTFDGLGSHAVVPEPASLALVGAALAGLSLTRRRRKT